ncbi:hypothetical protein GCM10007989_09830 [Devosia pacifica]|uniref:Uncharacterized protein n=1 Tax=Devosia pacifica TaxID=1335967 RepID=A0A918S1K5_9HYPH|nr:hypothetical protein [Devosia pacifica]GHA16739.1 hypothetical protein GCM10007989_09830 [Devosia pacifica]
MQKTTSPKRKSFRVLAIGTSTIAGFGAAAALLSGVTPAAAAATIARDPDAQIMAFMVPLTLLVFAVLFEVARFAFRDSLPAETPIRRTPRRPWHSQGGEGPLS